MDSFKIIANAHVITCDPNNRAGRYNLLIRDNRIVAISNQLDYFSSVHPDATIIDASQKLIIPGFVNAHFHSESVLLRARTEGLHFSLWRNDAAVQECINGLLDPLNHGDVRSMHLMSYFSHLKSGTTCVGEYGLPFSEESFGHALTAMEKAEVKNVVALQNWDQLVKASDVKSGRHRFVVNIGRAEDFTVYSFDNMIRAAKELKVPLLAHIAEQPTEQDVVKKSFQKSIVGVLGDYNVLGPESVFVHLNHVSSQETEALRDVGATVVLCARSAAFKRTGYPALRHLAGQRIRLAVGTDWGNVDMLEELRFLGHLHLLISGIPPFSCLQLLRMGTINGAHALGLSSETGSIEAGKKADLTFYSLTDLRLPVISDHEDADSLAEILINHLTCRDVSDVMVDGEFYLTRGEVMTMAEDEIVQGLRAASVKFFPEETRRAPAPETILADATLYRTAPRILPFTSSVRSSQLPDEGFESGFSVSEPLPGTLEFKPDNINMQPPPQIPSTESDNVAPNPEPRKDKWLTFGENEEF